MTIPVRALSQIIIAHGVPTRHHRRRIKTEKKAKVVAAGGDVLECRTNHLAFSSKDDLKKSFWENIHFGRWWFVVNWMISHFSKASIPPSNHYSINPFLQIILVQNS